LSRHNKYSALANCPVLAARRKPLGVQHA
jgi:hypothetical protein